MPKGSVLSAEEKMLITVYTEEGVRVREIGRRLTRSDKVIRNYLKDPQKYATVKRRPRQSKLSAEDKRNIVELASNSDLSLSKIKSTMNLPVCRETVRKVLLTSSNIAQTRINKPSNFTPEQKQEDLEFASLNVFQQRNCASTSCNEFYDEYSTIKIQYPDLSGSSSDDTTETQPKGKLLSGQSEAQATVKKLNNPRDIITVSAPGPREPEDECDVFGRHVAMQLRQLFSIDRIDATDEIHTLLSGYHKKALCADIVYSPSSHWSESAQAQQTSTPTDSLGKCIKSEPI
ncbi:uncharacterized protein LOC129778936 [Toxorhynchites rutilus septentrionalis]|uniref:uncharacterized protein LOC129778936 n=1 Tax=Toxorhynchites rutilus septentrionalis TaxID=329112 RepID=UPI00247AA8E4|nr:uncharacterized protein LOC129778936 [Toxorhynchites rutilus septentrionalis]